MRYVNQAPIKVYVVVDTDTGATVGVSYNLRSAAVTKMKQDLIAMYELVRIVRTARA